MFELKLGDVLVMFKIRDVETIGVELKLDEVGLDFITVLFV